MFNFFEKGNSKKKSDGLLNPDDLYFKNKVNVMKRPKNDLFEKIEEDLVTNDGRKLLKEA